MTDLTRTIEAEARAVEEGHRAILEPGGAVRVVSDTHPGKAFLVEFWQDGPNAEGSLIVFRCRPWSGPLLFADDHHDTCGKPGRLPCKHAALAARRLEREGLARFGPDGWVLAAPVPTVEPEPMVDPLKGLP